MPPPSIAGSPATRCFPSRSSPRTCRSGSHAAPADLVTEHEPCGLRRSVRRPGGNARHPAGEGRASLPGGWFDLRDHGVPLTPARPSPRRRTILAIAVGAQATLALLHQGLPVLGPALREHYGLSLGETGALLSAASVGILLATFAWGAGADRHGERAVIFWGLAGAALVLACAALLPSFAAMGAVLFGCGVCAAAGNAASGRLVMGWFPRHRRGTATGIRLTATPLGGALAALLLPLALAVGGLRAPFLALAALTGAIALVAAVWLRDPPVAGPGRSASGHPVRDPRVWRIGLSSAALVAAHIALSAFLVLYLDGQVGAPTWVSALAFGLTQLAGAGVRIAVGRRSDRTRERLASVHGIGALTVAVLAVAALSTLGPSEVTAVLMALGAIAAMAATAMPQVAVAELVGIARAGAAIGFQNTLFYVAVAGSPPLFGLLAQHLGWGAAFAAFAALAAVGVASLNPIRRLV